MIKAAASLCLLSLLLSCGCLVKTEQPSSALESQTPNPWKSSQSSHVRIQSQTLGQLPNSGLQLPVVSPDGKWIAYLDFRGGGRPEPSSLFTGRGLEPMSLHIQSTELGAGSRMLCESGAIWPSWSADSKRLLYIVYQQNGRCNLVVYEPQTSMTRRISMAVKPIVMPSLSPTGEHAAVVVFEPESQSASLRVVNLSSGKIEQNCPGASDGVQQLWPQWTPDGRIIFVHIKDGQSSLVQWRPGESGVQRLGAIQIGSSESGIYQAFSSLGQPLSGDARHFAYYNTGQDRIILVRLADGRGIPLTVGTRAGCWFGSGRFVAAEQKQMRLFSIRGDLPALLMRKLGLPRGANSTSGQLLLCSQSSDPRNFSLVKMKIVLVE